MHTQARTANNWSYCAAFTNLVKDAHPNSELFGDLAFSAWDWGVFGQGAHNVMKVWRNLGAHTVPGGSGLVILARRCSGPANHPIGLDRNEAGALLVAAGLGRPPSTPSSRSWPSTASESSEAIGANVEALGLERGHRTLTVLRKGGKIVTIALAPRTARAVDLAIGERLGGPIIIGPDGRRFDRHTAGRTVRRVARRTGVEQPIGHDTLRHAFTTAALDTGVPLRDKKAASHADPRTTMRYDLARVSLDRHTTYIVATYVTGTSR